MEETDEQSRFYKILEDVIDRAFKQSWVKVGGKEKTSKNASDMLYESIEDYKEKTGKRFRMKRDQKDRGLTREEAFKEIHEKA